METHGILQGSAMFLNALIEGQSIQEIVDIGYELLGNPMFVIDGSYKVIACTKHVEVDDPEWYKVVESKYLPYDVLVHNNSEMKEFFRKVRSSSYPILIQPKSTNCKILYSALVVNNKAIGYLIIPCHKKNFHENDIQIAALLSNVLSLEMQKNEFYENSKGIIYEYFIADMLDGNITNNKIIEERLKCLNWTLQENINVLTLQRKRNDSSSFSNICELVTNLINGSKAIVYDNYIVVVISRKRDSFPSLNDLNNLTDLLKNNEMYGGISRCFHNLSELSVHFRQSLKAIELGTIMNNQKVLFNYEEYSICHFMSIFSMHENLKAFCHPSLFVLEEYDDRYGDELMKCLYVYLENGENLIKASNILDIHRNTMGSRIKKIERITNLNIHDGDIAFHLLLSLKILHYIEKNKLD